MNASASWIPTPRGEGRRPAPPYPAAIGTDAHIGLAGRFVRLVERHTEADLSLLVLLFLAFVGNLFGRKAFVQAGGDKHHGNLFLCAVGATSSGRKGSAFAPLERVFERIDPDWTKTIQSGLSSGEGLIWSVRDPIYQLQKTKGKGRQDGYEEVCIDEGFTDKRRLVKEAEFCGPLQVMKRPGNTLSPLIRDAWDRGNLALLTKNMPAKATDAHISIVGNITQEELRREMESNEMYNGFANRFLWALCRRSKALPEGGQLLTAIDGPEFAKFFEAFHRIYGAVEGLVVRDAEAADLWGRDGTPGQGMYHELTRERPGLFGLCTARAHAHVLRLSLIYALLDGSQEIRREHLDAAHECWRYCEDSAFHIFGGALSDPLAARIFGALEDAPDGLTRTDINKLFAGNRKREEIDAALAELARRQLVEQERIASSGRPVERWRTKTGGSHDC